MEKRESYSNMNNKKRGRIRKEITKRIGRIVVIFLALMTVTVGLMIYSYMNGANATEIRLEAEVTSWEVSNFFQPYNGYVENIAMNPQIQDVLVNTVTGSNIELQDDYERAQRYLYNITKNIESPVVAAWVVDLDSSSLMMSNGYYSNGGFVASQYEWYSCIFRTI